MRELIEVYLACAVPISLSPLEIGVIHIDPESLEARSRIHKFILAYLRVRIFIKFLEATPYLSILNQVEE